MSDKQKQKKIYAVKVNDVKLDILPSDKEKKNEKLPDLFPKRHSNILIIGRKESGKTNLIYNIIKKSIIPGTEVWFYAQTFYNDPSYTKIADYLDEIGIDHFQSTNLNDLGDMLEMFENDGKDGNEIDKIIIFDDISTELEKNKNIEALIKQNRHYITKNVISSHNYVELPKKGRSNIDYLILFPKISDETLDNIYKDIQLDINLSDFKKLYKDSTNEEHSFLYINLPKQKFFKKFDTEYIIK